MNFDLPSDTETMCAALTAFARRDLGGTGTFVPQDFRRRWQLAGRQGILGATVPEELGGSGLDAVSAVALMEALGVGTADTGFGFSVAAHLFACLMPIVEFGTPEQRSRWLPRLSSGELIAAHAITEPEAGSDIFAMRATAERRGEGYLLNGVKAFVTNAPIADVFIVQAVTTPGGGFFGLTTFIVEAGTPGLTTGPAYDKVGLRGSPTGEVHLDEVRVPADCVLGGEGAGAAVFSDSMKWERTCLFGVYLGAMRRVLDSTIEFAGERMQFGSPIGEFQAVSHRIVDMVMRLECARLLLFKAAVDLTRGGAGELVWPALAKIAVSEAAVQLGLDAIGVRGGLGIADGEAETLLRDALPSRIFSGTNEIQKNNVARALGLGRRRPAQRR
ncbi:acyl-CoA dehydrogenase [Nocardia sp. Root136]|uniref:L-prolyl-[peptidyl-carrier protein] dehydrogenase n=1 Tax=Nocardia sp. Root136 TaxID=1736458 RepID=UPI0006F3F620|nr:L-prolyl-[peptidyl-carrier protein] dehydrogenase [Nocardia sp. Root136]KQY29166.1 acyl-CoA dehydrogenase [Nocardia sp. Root136]